MRVQTLLLVVVVMVALLLLLARLLRAVLSVLLLLQVLVLRGRRGLIDGLGNTTFLLPAVAAGGRGGGY